MTAYIDFPSWLRPEIISGFPIRWYGLMYIVAFAVTYFICMRVVGQNQSLYKKDTAASILMWVLFGLVIGARVFSCLVYHPDYYYWTQPWLIFWPFDSDFNFIGLQGMSYHGGVIGGALGALIFCKKNQESWLKWVDLVILGLPLGFTFGRLGNFINGELWGRVTTVPWGMVFPNAETFPSNLDWVKEVAEKIGMSLPEQGAVLVNLPRHPSQLYEAFFEGLAVWALIWFVFRKRHKFYGFLVSAYLFFFGFFRFFIEYFREPDKEIGFVIALGDGQDEPARLISAFNFSMGQILCVIMMAAGVLLCLLFKRHADKKGLEIKPQS